MKQKLEYIHTVQYYETDKMGITHHSNYIRWMEEARIDLLAQIGWDYPKLESMGIVSPVVSVSCDYKRPTTFSDKITVCAVMKDFGGAKYTFDYEMKNEDGTVVCTGSSQHALFNTEGKPIRMKREYTELYTALCQLFEE